IVPWKISEFHTASLLHEGLCSYCSSVFFLLKKSSTCHCLSSEGVRKACFKDSSLVQRLLFLFHVVCTCYTVSQLLDILDDLVSQVNGISTTFSATF
uniref:Uncharacterized protein n=1 Tax=Ficedula albicollis TaxID=59894 RepID=A0A803V0D4_FICAL